MESNGEKWSPLPRNVSDQIFLWQGERDRVRYSTSRLYTNVPQIHFDALREYADSHGFLLWSSPPIREKLGTIIVTEDGHADTKAFWKKLTA